MEQDELLFEQKLAFVRRLREQLLKERNAELSQEVLAAKIDQFGLSWEYEQTGGWELGDNLKLADSPFYRATGIASRMVECGFRIRLKSAEE